MKTTTKTTAELAASAILALTDRLAGRNDVLDLVYAHIQSPNAEVAAAIDKAMEARRAKDAASQAKFAEGISIPDPLQAGKAITIHARGDYAAAVYALGELEWMDKPSVLAPVDACLAWLKYTGNPKMAWEIAPDGEMIERFLAAGAPEKEAWQHVKTAKNGIAARIRRLMSARENKEADKREVKSMVIGATVKKNGNATFAHVATYKRVAKEAK